MDTIQLLHRAFEALYDLEMSCRSTKAETPEEVARVIIVTEEVHAALMAILAVLERLRSSTVAQSAPTDVK